jgi:hypothetical protein
MSQLRPCRRRAGPAIGRPGQPGLVSDRAPAVQVVLLDPEGWPAVQAHPMHLFAAHRRPPGQPQPGTDSGRSCAARSILEPEAPPEAKEGPAFSLDAAMARAFSGSSLAARWKSARALPYRFIAR